MSLTQVIPRLKAHGHAVDTCSWYPWMKMDADASCRGFRLGFDSLGMFHIGGDVHCALKWDFDSIGKILTAAACNPSQGTAVAAEDFDVYNGKNKPGQLWHCYKSKKNEKAGEISLNDKLGHLLEPSTDQARLDQLTADQNWKSYERTGRFELLPAYLKVKEKHLDTREWLVDPETQTVHNGAHKPLCVCGQTIHPPEANKKRKSAETNIQ